MHEYKNLEDAHVYAFNSLWYHKFYPDIIQRIDNRIEECKILL